MIADRGDPGAAACEADWVPGLVVAAEVVGDSLGDGEAEPVPVPLGDGLGDALDDGEALGLELGE